VNAGELLGGTGGSCPNSAFLAADGATNGVKALTYGGQWTCASLTYTGSAAGLVFDLTTLPVNLSLAPLQINGNLNVTGTVAVAVRNGYWPSVGTYPLVSYAGALSGPGSFVLASLPAGVEATLVNNTGAKRLDLSVTAVPTYAQQTLSVWTNLVGGSAGGTWGTSANWSGGVPNASDAIADFSTLDITATSIVTNDSLHTVGTLRFSDKTTASSNWIVTNSTLSLATSIGLPFITVSNQTATIYSLLAGSQGLIKNGAGTLSLNAINTFTGGTTIDQGTLTLNASDVAVRGTVTVNAGGVLSVAGVDWIGFGQNANRISTLNLVGGTVNNTKGTSFFKDATVNMTAGTWSGQNCYWLNSTLNTLPSANPSTLSGGIQFRSDYGLAGANLSMNVADGSAAIDLLISGVIADGVGPGRVTKSGAGTLVLTGANSYTGPTTINEGSLQLGNGGTVGKLATTGAITNHATLIFNRSNALTQGTDFSAGAICGTGGVLQAGGGTTTLNAANTFSGAVTVTNGVLRLASATALTATNDVFIVTASGAKLDLPAAGTTVIRRLYVNGVLKLKDKAYGPANLPAALSGSSDAYLLTTDGEAVSGTMIQVR
jgi:autotransporter-associated beta strand protein